MERSWAPKARALTRGPSPATIRTVSSRAQGELGRIANYDLLEILGKGGMATVYRARREGPGRAAKQVAIKVIRSRLGRQREFILMFLDETRVTMALTHRNIVQTFDAGEFEGRHYLVMELVEGISLQHLLQELGGEELLPLDLVLFIGMEICSALDYAHGVRLDDDARAGIIHRDVCPSNVLLSRHGDVKLADFGVATGSDRIGDTNVAPIRGKPSYMAPEQARGEATRRSDIFSLGATLYELITGQPARETANVLDISRGGEAFEAPRRPEMSRSLAALVVSCLSPDPFRRPESAAELRAGLCSELFQHHAARGGAAADPPERLRALLGRLLESSSSGQTDERALRADLLARAIREQASHVRPRTLSGSTGAAGEASTPGAPALEPSPRGASISSPSAAAGSPFTPAADATPGATTAAEAEGPDGAGGPPTAPGTGHRRSQRAWIVAAGCVLTLAIAAALGWVALRDPAPRGLDEPTAPARARGVKATLPKDAGAPNASDALDPTRADAQQVRVRRTRPSAASPR